MVENLQSLQCPSCGGRLIQGTTHNHTTRHGYHLTIDDVPAMICTQCGEAMLDLEVVERIGQALDAIDAQVEAIRQFAQKQEYPELVR